MSRKRKPENETDDQHVLRTQLEAIANRANRSEKTSWTRKLDKMIRLITTLRPIEDKILTIIKEEKTPIMDEINNIRKVMNNECVHPYEYLVKDNNAVTCRFCEKRLSIIDNGNKT